MILFTLYCAICVLYQFGYSVTRIYIEKNTDYFLLFMCILFSPIITPFQIGMIFCKITNK